MKNKKIINALVFFIIPLVLLTAGLGMKPDRGLPDHYQHQSIRGQEVTIYGKGIYQQMSAKIGPQNIAQDYATFLVAVPFLAVALFLANQGSFKGKILLAGALGYFLTTYLFYLTAVMYNPLFLAYIFLLSASFFALVLVLFSFNFNGLPKNFSPQTPSKLTGVFLIIIALVLGGIWLRTIFPPLVGGSVFPPQLAHYTTLTIEGLGLALILPLTILVGWLLIKQQPLGFLLGSICAIFLSLITLALAARFVVLGLLYYNVLLSIFVSLILFVLALFSSVLLLKNVKE